MGFTLKQKLNRLYVSSKIIYFIESDTETNLLKIGFNDGSIGYFKNVPVGIVSKFKSAKSKGAFFYRNLYKSSYKREIKYT